MSSVKISSSEDSVNYRRGNQTAATNRFLTWLNFSRINTCTRLTAAEFVIWNLLRDPLKKNAYKLLQRENFRLV